MKVGMLGSGNVAQALCGGFLELGHEVKLGSRSPEKLNDFVRSVTSGAVSAGTFAEAAAFGEVLVLATHGLATISAIDQAGKERFAGKIVVDVTNPLDFSDGVPPRFAATLGDSLGERIQRHIPEAHVVKAFNIVNCSIMVNARLNEGSPDMFMAGNAAHGKQWVSDLAHQWGWNTCNDLGGIENAFWLETFAMFWIVYGFRNNHWTHAFRLLKS